MSNIRMIQIFSVIGLLALNVSLHGADSSRTATHAVSVGKVSLTIYLPTRNKPGDPLLLKIVLRNDSDLACNFRGRDESPFDVSIRDSDGRDHVLAGAAPDEPYTSLEPHKELTGSIDLAKTIARRGQFFVTVSRKINETDNDRWDILEINGASFFVGPAPNPNLTDN